MHAHLIKDSLLTLYPAANEDEGNEEDEVQSQTSCDPEPEEPEETPGEADSRGRQSAPNQGRRGPHLSRHLGEFGGEHIDAGDHEGSWSAACAYSNLDPDDYDPGYFFYLDIMVCVRLDQGVMCYFSGLRPHGSSAAICLNGDPAPNAFRVVVVGYPVRELLEGHTVLPLAALPGGAANHRVLRVSPEMTPNRYVNYQAIDI